MLLPILVMERKGPGEVSAFSQNHDGYDKLNLQLGPGLILALSPLYYPPLPTSPQIIHTLLILSNPTRNYLLLFFVCF